MNNKIKNYVDVLFTDVPRGKKASELKEEMLSNMSERFEDYIYQGKTENQAYSLVVSNMGDVDELLAQVMPDADFKTEAKFYRKRNARNTAIGVAMYIIGAAVLIAFATIGEFVGMEEVSSIIGLLILLLLTAVATGLIIYTNMSTPLEYKDYDEQTAREKKRYASKNGKLFESLMSIYWTIITCVYLAISFITHEWGITWIIWVLAGVFSQIIEVIFEMRNNNEE